MSPLYNFPKDGLLIQNKIVRSGKIAWKFKNGDGDCGQQRKSDECNTFRERSEVSMLGLKSKNTWFKFSIYIPENSEFTIPISNTIWQIHSKAGPVNFMFRVAPNGDLQLSLIHISEPTRLLSISYAVFCLKKKMVVEISFGQMV